MKKDNKNKGCLDIPFYEEIKCSDKLNIINVVFVDKKGNVYDAYKKQNRKTDKKKIKKL
jgi:hypothetical protein